MENLNDKISIIEDYQCQILVKIDEISKIKENIESVMELPKYIGKIKKIKNIPEGNIKYYLIKELSDFPYEYKIQKKNNNYIISIELPSSKIFLKGIIPRISVEFKQTKTTSKCTVKAVFIDYGIEYF